MQRSRFFGFRIGDTISATDVRCVNNWQEFWCGRLLGMETNDRVYLQPYYYSGDVNRISSCYISALSQKSVRPGTKCTSLTRPKE